MRVCSMPQCQTSAGCKCDYAWDRPLLIIPPPPDLRSDETKREDARVAAAVARERERCAKIADADAAAAQEQINRNDEYMNRTGSTDEGPNNLCRHRKYHSERIAANIRGERS